MYYYDPQFINTRGEDMLPEVTELYVVVPEFGKTLRLTTILSCKKEFHQEAVDSCHGGRYTRKGGGLTC